MTDVVLADFLAMGTMGRSHLILAAQSAFRVAERGGDPGAAALGARLLCLAWGEFPLDGAMATQLVRLSGAVPAVAGVLTEFGLQLAARVARADNGGNLPEAGQLFASGEYEEMGRCFETAVSRGPVLPVIRQAMHFQGILSNFAWLERFLERTLLPVDPELGELLLADVWLSGGMYGQAVGTLGKMVARSGHSVWGVKLAAALAGAGRIERAMNVLVRVLEDFPDHTTALLLLDSLAFPARRDVGLDGKCAVSIYSFNKSEELGRTLESVLASNLGPEVGDVTVRVLVNGSTDDSRAVAEAARDRFGGNMEIVVLPVNVGAPAARNWLLDAALREGARWIAFLDDDVLVPRDWLAGLAAGVKDFPEAGVWGCRVADVRSPSLVQHGDGFLLPQDEAARRGGRFSLQEPCVEVMAESLLGYRRYAASVTGCCHLFETDSLAGSGGFDLLFSPSQFDDLDLDLRRLRQGRLAAYLGDLRITHLRESTHFLKLSEGAAARSEMHRHLLEERHAPVWSELCAIQRAAVRADLTARRERLQRSGFLPDNS
ncbi:glycosyltransferase family A protein [Desulfovibrio sp. Fe33]|uniref:glycosyltransferase family A protein n=1 Tax=Desulfovibrio sp. Fe33 TaxID=3020842 RepID=UPI00234CBACB|nr:glycosyltransferase family A protein [Desulfovibrio sp. Fe33]